MSTQAEQLKEFAEHLIQEWDRIRVSDTIGQEIARYIGKLEAILEENNE